MKLVITIFLSLILSSLGTLLMVMSTFGKGDIARIATKDGLLVFSAVVFFILFFLSFKTLWKELKQIDE
jgi:hypothetical protein